ncbi:MAG: pilus assembly protein [Anaerolineae bacterium]|nr:pilus assembly protein [Anaerolineae bacterium]
MNETTASVRRGKRSAGQGLLEFALILPLLLLIIMAIIDFGWIFLVYANVFNASREGVRYGVTRPRDYFGIDSSARSRIAIVPSDDVNISTWYDHGPDEATAWFTDTNTVQIGDRVVVDVQYTVMPITPLMQPILGDLNLHARAARTIQNLGDAVSLPPPGSGGPPGGDAGDGGVTTTATATSDGTTTPSATPEGSPTPTPDGTTTSTSTPFPTGSPTPTPLPIVIADPLTHGDMTVEGDAQPGKWVTMRDIQSGVIMEVEVGQDGNFIFELDDPLVGGHTVVVQGYGQQDTAVVEGGTPTATPTSTPSPTPTPATAFIVVSPECAGAGQRTITVYGYNMPTSGAQLHHWGVYWDYGGSGQQYASVAPGSTTIQQAFNVNLAWGTYTVRIQAEKSNGGLSSAPDTQLTYEFESPCSVSLPNLQVTGLALQEPVTGTNQSVYLDVGISNVGTADVTTLFWVDLFADPDMETSLDQQVSVDWVALNGLSAGATLTFTMYYLPGFDSLGDHTLVAMADTWNQIIEFEEEDNVSELVTLTLTQDNPTPTPVPTVTGTPPAPGGFSGTVYVDGFPQLGADVYIYDLTGRLVASTRSGMNGAYLVDDLMPGEYVIVGQMRMGNQLYRSQATSTVPDGTVVTGVDLMLVEL